MTELEPGPEFEALLQFLRQTRGFDFTSYKRTTLCRRVAKRMGDVHVESFEGYIDYLEVHGDEFAQLFDTTDAWKGTQRALLLSIALAQP